MEGRHLSPVPLDVVNASTGKGSNVRESGRRKVEICFGACFASVGDHDGRSLALD
jgi:hypothetical protein